MKLAAEVLEAAALLLVGRAEAQPVRGLLQLRDKLAAVHRQPSMRRVAREIEYLLEPILRLLERPHA